MDDRVPIEPFEDDEAGGGGLGPAGIEDAMAPLTALTGEEALVFVRDDVDVADVAMPIVPIDATRLVGDLETIVGERPGVTLVSDGYMSHAITFLGGSGDRIDYFDPWNTSSFLEAGRNVAGVEARRDEGGRYSVSRDELARVIVAQGVLGLGNVPGLVPPPTWDAFRADDFFTFFNLRPDGEPVPTGDGFAQAHKTGGFQEYVDLGFEVGADGRVRAGVLELSQEWLLGAGLPFGMDVLRSFVAAMTPAELTFAPLGLPDEPPLPSPDRHLVGAFVEALVHVGSGRPPRPGPRTGRLMPLFAAIVGQEATGGLGLFFQTIAMTNRSGILTTRVELRM